MGALSLLHGTLGTVILCVLIFAEETGVPLPLVPGDVVLVIGGVLVGNGSINPWVYLPLVAVAAIPGALGGYSWARMVGARGLVALAKRFHATRHLERAERSLHRFGARGVAVGRFIPGLRVYTSLLSGALHLRVRSLLTGAIPAVAIWVSAMTLVGVLIGRPAASFLTRFTTAALAIGLRLSAVSVAGLGALLLVRRLRRRNEALPALPAAAEAEDLGRPMPTARFLAVAMKGTRHAQ